MSVEQSDSVDILSVDEKKKEVVLTITDHLDWSNTMEHQQVLQKKLNTYLAFVEGGELYQCRPDTQGLDVVLEVVFRYRPDHEGRAFLRRVEAVIQGAGFRFHQEQFAESYDN